MRLKDLFANFIILSAEEQTFFLRKYRDRRMIDLEAEPRRSKGKKSSSAPRPKISEEEKLLLKKLGLTQKDLKILASIGE